MIYFRKIFDLATFEMGNTIPKIIHQTYPCKSQLPVEIQDNINKICLLNSNWEYRLYDDTDIEAKILKHYGLEILHIYQKINPSYGPARADFFRYLLMYAEGGMYLDIKSLVTRPFDEVISLDASYILSKWDSHHRAAGYGMHRDLQSVEGGEYQQWHIIAVPGHPFLRAVIKRVIKNIQKYNVLNTGVGKLGVLKTTGPIAYTLAIENIKHLHPFREIDITQDIGIEYSIYNTPSQKGNHTHIFKKHYMRLETSIIKPHSIKDYILILLYYVKIYIKKMLCCVLPSKST